MTFILKPEHGDDIQVNGWNWRPTLELLRSKCLIEEELYQRMSAQGCGATVDAYTAEQFADAIDARLKTMCPDDRILTNLSIISQPKSHRIDAPDIYSATYDWLKDFSVFCRRCGGFEVV